MINVRIDGDKEVISGLNNMVKELQTPESMLDKVAYETQIQMKSESPYKTGALLGSIKIDSPNTFTRIIEPVSRNFAPGNKYALPIETGWGTVGVFPNVNSISIYYGVDMKLAFAIAAGIASKTYPANPFVERTYNWLMTRIDSHIYPYLEKITARYMAG